MDKTKLNQILSLMILLFIITISNSYALKNDQTKIAHIQANYIKQLPQQNQTTLLGHVTIDQGSTHIRANKIYVYRSTQGETKKIILYGKPASYKTLTEKNKTPMTAIAQKIIYYPEQHKIILIGKAHIDQNGNTIIGPHLVYNTETQTLLSNTQGEHTILILQPQAKA